MSVNFGRGQVAVVAALAATTVAAVPAAARTTATIPVLKGVNVFAGSSSSTMLLRLSRSTHVTIDDITVTGRGRFYGLILEQNVRVPRAGLAFVNSQDCTTPGCTGSYKYGLGGAVVFGPDIVRGTIPAGVYRAYLIADHAPVRVTLQLRGLSGTATFNPRHPLKARILTPTPTQAEPANGPLLFAAGSTQKDLGSRGAYVARLAWKYEPLPHEWTQWAESAYAGPAPSGPTPAYQQGAGGNVIVPVVGGNGDSGKTRTVAAGVSAPYYVSSYWALAGFVPKNPSSLGPFSVGISANTTGPVYDAHYSVLWLDRQ